MTIQTFSHGKTEGKFLKKDTHHCQEARSYMFFHIPSSSLLVSQGIPCQISLRAMKVMKSDFHIAICIMIKFPLFDVMSIYQSF